MSTVILKWDPNVSSYSMFHYLSDIVSQNFGERCRFNWTVWGNDKVVKGDRYYLVKKGFGQKGIIERGTIVSNPHLDRDSKNKGEKKYFVDFEPEIMINTVSLPILTSAELQKEIPEIVWEHGPSGQILTEEQAAKLDNMWDTFVENHREDFLKVMMSRRDENDMIYWDR